jgi:mitogen-activated protein kinase 8 interacting protein 3
LNVKEYSLNQLNGNFEDINFIEIENESEGNDSTLNNEKTEKSVEATLPSSYPTMWMGSQEGFLLIHSSISNVGASIERIKLKDAVLCIIQNCERVIVGLADGSAAIFKRSSATNNWDLKTFQLINFDKPHHSIRCLANVYENVWCGCRNKIFVLNPIELKVLSVIEVHPRKENQVRHIVSVKDGVWISIRLDSTLRLYHAQSYQPLQYLDIEPFITRMLGTSNLGLSLIRISSLITGSRRLWIGTGNGVVLSIPFSEKTPKNILVNEATNKSIGPGGSAMRVVAEKENLNIPYCDINDTQFSFHGHRDSIKFFLNVPSEIIQKAQQKQDEVASTPTPQSYEKIETNLILSGGHGYIDFRIGDLEANNTQSKMIADPSAELSKNDRSHLIVWQINNY